MEFERVSLIRTQNRAERLEPAFVVVALFRFGTHPMTLCLDRKHSKRGTLDARCDDDRGLPQ